MSAAFWALHWSFIVSVIFLLKAGCLASEFSLKSNSERATVLERPRRTMEKKKFGQHLCVNGGWLRKIATGNNSPQIPRDHCSWVLGESKVIKRFSTVWELDPLTPMCSRINCNYFLWLFGKMQKNLTLTFHHMVGDKYNSLSLSKFRYAVSNHIFQIL